MLYTYLNLRHKPTKASDFRQQLLAELPPNSNLLSTEHTKVAYRSQIMADMTSRSFDWFITLTFAYNQTNYDDVVKGVKRLVNRVSIDIFGKRSKKRLVHYGVIERNQNQSSLHVHLLVQHPRANFLDYLLSFQQKIDQTNIFFSDKVRGLSFLKFIEPTGKNKLMGSFLKHWKDITGTNMAVTNLNEDYWFQLIENLDGLAHYLTKQCYRYDDTISYELVCLSGRKNDI